MRLIFVPALAVALGLSAATVAVPAAGGAPGGTLISVSGTGVAMYPAFDPAVTRYGVTTTGATGGTVSVTVSDAAGAVSINGRPESDGQQSLTGLVEGDEISVFVDAPGGRTAYSLVYLPAGFPTLATRTPTADKGPEAGATLLTLNRYLQTSLFYRAAVDSHGVPLVVTSTPTSIADFKRLPNGNYSVARAVDGGSGGHYNAEIVELDQSFQEVRETRAVGLANTDFHDYLLEPDGTRYYVSYEPDGGTGLIDAVIQGVTPGGDVFFQWDSRDLVDETILPDDPDYAHINSIDVMADGNILASFRHFSSVFKIATHDQPGYAERDIIWKLGGRDVGRLEPLDGDGDPDGGPCAQHTATELANGNILIFDNGSTTLVPPVLCLAAGETDPANGDTVQRTPTRISEWAIDEDAGTATIDWNYNIPGGLALFAGSAQRLPGGNTMIGHASATVNTNILATEVDPDDEIVWELKTVGETWFSYRAQKAVVPDAQRPVVSVSAPTAGAEYAQGAAVIPSVECTDRGGSTLQTCVVPTIATSTPGTHTYTVTAIDGAGNTTTVDRSYTVVAPTPPVTDPPPAPAPGRPDIAAKAAGTSYVGAGRYDWSGKHVLGVKLPRSGAQRVARVRVTNRGMSPARFSLERTPSSRKFRASLTATGGVRRSPLLAPGKSWVVTVRVTRTGAARVGDTRGFRIRVRSTTSPALRDAVVVRVRATR